MVTQSASYCRRLTETVRIWCIRGVYIQAVPRVRRWWSPNTKGLSLELIAHPIPCATNRSTKVSCKKRNTKNSTVGSRCTYTHTLSQKSSVSALPGRFADSTNPSHIYPTQVSMTWPFGLPSTSNSSRRSIFARSSFQSSPVPVRVTEGMPHSVIMMYLK